MTETTSREIATRQHAAAARQLHLEGDPEVELVRCDGETGPCANWRPEGELVNPMCGTEAELCEECVVAHWMRCVVCANEG